MATDQHGGADPSTEVGKARLVQKDRAHHGGDEVTEQMEVTAAKLGGALVSLLKTTAAVLLAIAVIWQLAVRLGEPPFRNYLVAMNEPLASALAEIQESLRSMGNRLDQQRPVPFLQIMSAGLVIDEGPFKPGDVVRVVYLLQRNQSCPADVEVRFLDGSGQINTALTRSIRATRASVTQEPMTFTVAIPLPDHMPPGRYSYAPIVTPDVRICPGEPAAPVQPSEFFTVVSD